MASSGRLSRKSWSATSNATTRAAGLPASVVRTVGRSGSWCSPAAPADSAPPVMPRGLRNGANGCGAHSSWMSPDSNRLLKSLDGRRDLGQTFSYNLLFARKTKSGRFQALLSLSAASWPTFILGSTGHLTTLQFILPDDGMRQNWRLIRATTHS